MVAGTPPDDVAQPSALQFCDPERFQYTVLGAENVMPELPPQSPARVGDDPAATPAIVMSLKSQSVADKVLTLSVRVVTRVSERTKMRRTAVAPAHVRVPEMVLFAAKVYCFKPADAGAVRVKSLKVFAPVTT